MSSKGPIHTSNSWKSLWRSPLGEVEGDFSGRSKLLKLMSWARRNDTSQKHHGRGLCDSPLNVRSVGCLCFSASVYLSIWGVYVCVYIYISLSIRIFERGAFAGEGRCANLSQIAGQLCLMRQWKSKQNCHNV